MVFGANGFRICIVEETRGTCSPCPILSLQQTWEPLPTLQQRFIYIILLGYDLPDDILRNSAPPGPAAIARYYYDKTGRLTTEWSKVPLDKTVSNGAMMTSAKFRPAFYYVIDICALIIKETFALRSMLKLSKFSSFLDNFK